MPELKCETGSTVENKIGWHRIQFRPQPTLRFGQNVQPGIECCVHACNHGTAFRALLHIRYSFPRLLRGSGRVTARSMAMESSIFVDGSLPARGYQTTGSYNRRVLLRILRKAKRTGNLA